MSLKRTNRLSLDSRMPTYRPSTSRWSSHEPNLNQEQRQVLRQFARALIERGVEKLRQEFVQAQLGSQALDYGDVVAQHLSRCRYRDVVCWEPTRVRLRNAPDNNDFIHANLVKHRTLPNDFICCQGPIDSTTSDFWEMVWQEKSKLVIMLCQVVEEKRFKCAQYWPRYQGDVRQYGPYTVYNKMVDSSENSLKRTHLTVQYKGEEHHLEHLQWTAWKDRKAPKGYTTAFRLLAMARKRGDRPTIVHCSAGVGRTGTLVLLGMLRGAVLNPALEPINTLKLLRELRQQRGQCIQTEDQYLFLHVAMLQYAVKSRAITVEEAAGFVHDYDNLLNRDKPPTPLIPTLLPSNEKRKTAADDLDARLKDSFRISVRSVPMQRLMHHLAPFRAPSREC